MTIRKTYEKYAKKIDEGISFIMACKGMF